WCTAAALLSGVIGAVSVRELSRTPTAGTIRFAIPIPDTMSANLAAQGRQGVVISPAGHQLIFSANGRLYRRRLSCIEPTPIAGSDVGGATGAVFSPDGRFVAFFASADRTLRKLPVDGGTAITLAPFANNPYGMSWDGDALLVGQGPAGIFRVPAAGGAP